MRRPKAPPTGPRSYGRESAEASPAPAWNGPTGARHTQPAQPTAREGRSRSAPAEATVKSVSVHYAVLQALHIRIGYHEETAQDCPDRVSGDDSHRGFQGQVAPRRSGHGLGFRIPLPLHAKRPPGMSFLPLASSHSRWTRDRGSCPGLVGGCSWSTSVAPMLGRCRPPSDPESPRSRDGRVRHHSR